jgi:hypothetical protein
MAKSRPVHPDFQFFLNFKEKPLINLFNDLRDYILEIYPASIELIYHTHALSSVFCFSEKLSDAFCMINIYSQHLNLGFNKGSLLKDPHQLLKGTGNLIRHIPVEVPADYRNKNVKELIKRSIDYGMKDAAKAGNFAGKTISKIKTK